MNLVRSRRSSSLTLATKGRKPSTISPRLSRIVFSDMGETHSGGDTLRLVIEDGAPLAVAPVSRKEGETGKCEMPVGRRLLSEMDLTNALVCSDALHCQHETVRAVARSNGESLVQTKRQWEYLSGPNKGERTAVETSHHASTIEIYERHGVDFFAGNAASPTPRLSRKNSSQITPCHYGWSWMRLQTESP